MKKLELILISIAFGVAIYYTEATAQNQFDYLGGLPVDANVTGCFYIDLNTDNTNTGENDVKLVHGGGEIYFDGIYADSARMPAISTKAPNGKFMWADCNDETNIYNRSRVYLISDIQSLSEGNHVLSFKYRSMYNYIVLRVEGSMIYIRGWRFNLDPEWFDCFELPLPIK